MNTEQGGEATVSPLSTEGVRMFITKDDLGKAVDEGWRWLANCDDPTAIDKAMATHGPRGLTFGDRLDGEAGSALYVRDVAELLAELREDLLNFECGHELDNASPSC